MLFLVPSIPAFAASGAGSTSANFLKIGMAARPAGMGDSFTAVADDPTAIYWNPAGLVLTRGVGFSLTHSEWMEGINHEFLAGSMKLPNRSAAVGLGLTYLGTGKFRGAYETPTGDYGGPGDVISSSDFALSLARADRLGEWIPKKFFNKSILGAKLTLLNQKVVEESSTSISMQLGYLYEIKRKTCYLGLVLDNVGPRLHLASQPTMLRLGASYRLKKLLLKKGRKRDQLIFAIDPDAHFDTGFRFNTGMEYMARFGESRVALRGGYRQTDLGGMAGLTTGVGLARQFDTFDAGLDYAFVPYGILGQTHRVTLNLRVGGSLMAPQLTLSAPQEFILNKDPLRIKLGAVTDEELVRWKVNITGEDGKVVKSWTGKDFPPGSVTWDGKDALGSQVPDGNYKIDYEAQDDEDQRAKIPSKPLLVREIRIPPKTNFEYRYRLPGDLLFPSGKTELAQKAFQLLYQTATAIRQRYPESRILVIGHTDDTKIAPGALKYKTNEELSLARAEAVRDYLIKAGLPAGSFSVAGYGARNPMVPNTTPENKAKNRRVELVVSGMKAAVGVEVIIDEALQLMKEKQFETALARLKTAAATDPRNAKAYRLAGDCYLQLKSMDGAVIAYRKAVELNPKDVDLKAWLDKYGDSSTGVVPTPTTSIPQP